MKAGKRNKQAGLYLLYELLIKPIHQVNYYFN